jgi:hypothetical protein
MIIPGNEQVCNAGAQFIEVCGSLDIHGDDDWAVLVPKSQFRCAFQLPPTLIPIAQSSTDCLCFNSFPTFSIAHPLSQSFQGKDSHVVEISPGSLPSERSCKG